jgi:hypothetical protein
MWKQARLERLKKGRLLHISSNACLSSVLGNSIRRRASAGSETGYMAMKNESFLIFLQSLSNTFPLPLGREGRDERT